MNSRCQASSWRGCGGRGFELEIEESEDVQRAGLVLVVKLLVAGFRTFLSSTPLEIRNWAHPKSGVPGRAGAVVQIEEYEFHGVWLAQVALQDFAQGRVTARLRSREAASRASGAQQAGQVAAAVAQWYWTSFRLEAKAAGWSPGPAGSPLRSSSVRASPEDQALADAGAQVFAQARCSGAARPLVTSVIRRPAGQSKARNRAIWASPAEGLTSSTASSRPGALGRGCRRRRRPRQIAGRSPAWRGGGDDTAQGGLRPLPARPTEERGTSATGTRFKAAEEVGVGGKRQSFPAGRRVGAGRGSVKRIVHRDGCACGRQGRAGDISLKFRFVCARRVKPPAGVAR